MKMIERLLFDRIEHEAAAATVSGEHDLIAGAHSNETHAALSVGERAEPRADVTLDPPVVEPVMIATREKLHGLAIVAGVPLLYASRHAVGSPQDRERCVADVGRV